jgi:hypothetical protein
MTLTLTPLDSFIRRRERKKIYWENYIDSLEV